MSVKVALMGNSGGGYTTSSATAMHMQGDRNRVSDARWKHGREQPPWSTCSKAVNHAVVNRLAVAGGEQAARYDDRSDRSPGLQDLHRLVVLGQEIFGKPTSVRKISTYLEKRFKIRPAGVVSKKDIGLLKILNAILSCNFREA